MRSATRHQLKQNSFAETTVETISWARDHQSKLTAALIALAVVIALVIAGWAFVNYRNQQASQELRRRCKSTMRRFVRRVSHPTL